MKETCKIAKINKITEKTAKKQFFIKKNVKETKKKSKTMQLSSILLKNTNQVSKCKERLEM